MHFSVLVFHKAGEDIDYMLKKYDQESNLTEFTETMSKKEGEKVFQKEVMNADIEVWKSRLGDLIRFKAGGTQLYMTEDQFNSVDEDGNYGYFSNPDGRYDWYVPGGRWANSLVTKTGMTGDSNLSVDNIDLDKTLKSLKKEYNTVEDLTLKSFFEEYLSADDGWQVFESDNDIIEVFKRFSDYQVTVVDCHT